MNIINYVKSLIPRLSRSDLLSDIDITLEVLEQTHPKFKTAMDNAFFTEQFKFMSPWVNARLKTFDREMRGVSRKNPYEIAAVVLPKLEGKLNWVRKQFEQKGDIETTALTHNDAALLQYYEAIRFYIDYSRKLLLLTYAYEAPARSGSESSEPYSKAEKLQIEQRFIDYCAVTKALVKYNDAEKLISKIPNIKVDTSDVGMASGNAFDGVDPMRMGFTNSNFSPVWLVRSALAEWEVSRHKAAKEEAAALELRVLEMKMLQAEGEDDAALAKQIEYQENRLRDLNYKIAKKEAEYA